MKGTDRNSEQNETKTKYAKDGNGCITDKCKPEVLFSCLKTESVKIVFTMQPCFSIISINVYPFRVLICKPSFRTFCYQEVLLQAYFKTKFTKQRKKKSFDFFFLSRPLKLFVDKQLISTMFAEVI